MDDREVQEQVEKVEAALEALERLPSGPRETALDAVTALLELYGEGWSRVLGHLEEEEPGSAAALSADELVGHLLMIHDLHPAGAEDRVRQTMDDLRPYLRSHGHSVGLVSVEDGVARIRLEGTGAEHAPPADQLRETVESAVLGSAPELKEAQVQIPTGTASGSGLVQIQVPGGRDGTGAEESS